ncbi:hypothetical protein ACHAWF_002169, partial [Thalassiosira exigua]
QKEKDSPQTLPEKKLEVVLGQLKLAGGREEEPESDDDEEEDDPGKYLNELLAVPMYSTISGNAPRPPASILQRVLRCDAHWNPDHQPWNIPHRAQSGTDDGQIGRRSLPENGAWHGSAEYNDARAPSLHLK